MQPRLIVVDEYRCRDVHGVDQHQALADAALVHGRGDLRRDVLERNAGRQVERQVFGVGFHADHDTASKNNDHRSNYDEASGGR